MSIKNLVKIPTGFLFNTEGSKGLLETLSIGDYGKKHNIKAEFLGFHEEVNGVDNMPVMPLSEKWVITLSTQFGCPQHCTFCDVPNLPFLGNATFADLALQLENAVKVFPEVHYTDRLNLHFARMGEPILNSAVFDFAEWLYRDKEVFQDETGLRTEVIHPVLSTSLPKFKKLEERIHRWCRIKNDLYRGQAGLQFSINSTDEDQRKHMFKDGSITLDTLSGISKSMQIPLGRKYCLNFAYSDGFEIDARKLVSMFDPEDFMVKITPMHNTKSCSENKLHTTKGYESYIPYKKVESELISAGFEVIVFIPSMDEEDGLVTCGNLALSGREIKNALNT